MKSYRVKYRVPQIKKENDFVEFQIQLFSDYVKDNPNPNIEDIMNLGINPRLSQRLLENYNQIKEKQNA